MRLLQILAASVVAGQIAGCASLPGEFGGAEPLAMAPQPLQSRNCVGGNIPPRQQPQAREAECLRELPNVATRDGDVLTLRLDNGKTAAFRGNPSACRKQDTRNCGAYWLVGFQPTARLFVLYTVLRDGYDVRLVSARTGATTKYDSDPPQFSPDGQHFVITVTSPFAARKFDIAVGSVTGGAPKLVWQRAIVPSEPDEEWQAERWLDNDSIALFTIAPTPKCPSGDCRATLVRSGGTWTVRVTPPKVAPPPKEDTDPA